MRLSLINHNVYTQNTNSLWNEEMNAMCTSTCTSSKCGGALEVVFCKTEMEVM